MLQERGDEAACFEGCAELADRPGVTGWQELDDGTTARLASAPFSRTRFKPGERQESARSKPFVLGHKDFSIIELAFCTSVIDAIGIVDANRTQSENEMALTKQQYVKQSREVAEPTPVLVSYPQRM